MQYPFSTALVHLFLIIDLFVVINFLHDENSADNLSQPKSASVRRIM